MVVGNEAVPKTPAPCHEVTLGCSEQLRVRGRCSWGCPASEATSPAATGEISASLPPTTASQPKHPVSTDQSSGPSLAGGFVPTPEGCCLGAPQEERRPRTAPGPSGSLMLLPGGPEAGSQAPAGFSLPPARSLRPSEVQQALQHSRGWHSTRAPRPLLLASSSSRPLQKRSPWCHQAGTGSTAQPGSHSSVNSDQRDPGPTLTPAPRDAGGSC